MGETMPRGVSSAGVALVASALFAGSSGCAAQSCPAVYLNPVVHVDATAWLDKGEGGVASPPRITATICVAADCVTAAPASSAAPGDLVGALALPAGRVTVRVRLKASDGRSLDRTTTAGANLTRPFGSGCAGREEIDLAVSAQGSLTPGTAAPVS
jgi:hypothetical protein